MFHPSSLLQIFDGKLDPCPIPVEGINFNRFAIKISHKAEVSPVGEELALLTNESGTAHNKPSTLIDC